MLHLLILSLSILTLTTTIYHLYSAAKTLYPLSYPLIGYLRNRHRFHDWLTDTLSTTPTLTLHHNPFLNRSNAVCTAHPANLHHILRTSFGNYTKNRRYASVMRELLGTGIFNSDGKLWSLQCRIPTHVFNSKSFKTYIFDTVQLQLSKSLIPYLLSVGDHTVDLQQVLRTFNFDNICNVVFGIDPCLSTSNSKLDSNYLLFVQAFDTAVEHASNQFMSPVPVLWKFKRFFNKGKERKYEEAIKTVKQFVTDEMKSKETQKRYKTNQDLLSRFMASRWDMGLNNEERRKMLRDNIINIIFASKDSTPIALTWFFWLLDGHPHCKHMIYKEFTTLMMSTRRINPPNLTFDDLKRLNYLHAALSESMRLFPPVPITSRSAIDENILPDGTLVGEGWFVDYSAYAMGRMKKLWGPDCREFKPERWLDGNGMYINALDRFNYPVFSYGTRVCLGEEMAYLQMKLVVVAVMHEFEIEVVGGGGTPEKMVAPPYSQSIVLSMKNGLHVRLKKREQISNGSRGVVGTLFGMFFVGLIFYKHKQYKYNCITK